MILRVLQRNIQEWNLSSARSLLRTQGCKNTFHGSFTSCKRRKLWQGLEVADIVCAVIIWRSDSRRPTWTSWSWAEEKLKLTANRSRKINSAVTNSHFPVGSEADSHPVSVFRSPCITFSLATLCWWIPPMNVMYVQYVCNEIYFWDYFKIFHISPNFFHYSNALNYKNFYNN